MFQEWLAGMAGRNGDGSGAGASLIWGIYQYYKGVGAVDFSVSYLDQFSWRDMIVQAGLVYAFQKEGYEVEAAESVRELRKILLQKTNFDVMILDCNLPDGDGFVLCR